MIFITVGTQLPFDRMIKAIDKWAGNRNDGKFFAQIGPGNYLPKNMKWTDFIQPEEFKLCFRKADVIIAHAGMGSILSALETGKPIIILPRQAKFKEHRNDHQMATAKHFNKIKGITVAFNEEELIQKLDNIGTTMVSKAIAPHASKQLIDYLKQFIDS